MAVDTSLIIEQARFTTIIIATMAAASALVVVVALLKAPEFTVGICCWSWLRMAALFD